MLIGERAARVSCPYQNKLRGHGTRVKLARGRVGKLARWRGELVQGASWQVGMLARGDARTRRSRAPT